MIAGIATGLLFGGTLGICVAPLWMMLSLPMRLTDVLDAGTMPMCAWALVLGAALAALAPLSLHLGLLAGVFGQLAGGIFVGMLASALTEALEVIPALYNRLHISRSMRGASIALMLGKTCGALVACMIGG